MAAPLDLRPTGFLGAPGGDQPGRVHVIIWGPTGGTDPNADQALVVHFVSTPSGVGDGFVRYTYCPTPGFAHLLLPGGADPGPDCLTRRL